MRTTKTFSFSLPIPVADVLEADANARDRTPGQHITDIVLGYLKGMLPEAMRRELALLHELRDDAIEKLHGIRATEGLSKDITLRVFQACRADREWMAKYEEYIQGNPYQTGNPRKTNANQTIGSRIKSVLGASDMVDETGKPLRSRALKEVIQTYQLLDV